MLDWIPEKPKVHTQAFSQNAQRRFLDENNYKEKTRGVIHGIINHIFVNVARNEVITSVNIFRRWFVEISEVNNSSDSFVFWARTFYRQNLAFHISQCNGRCIFSDSKFLEWSDEKCDSTLHHFLGRNCDVLQFHPYSEKKQHQDYLFHLELLNTPWNSLLRCFFVHIVNTERHFAVKGLFWNL